MQPQLRQRTNQRLTMSRLATPPPAPVLTYPEGIGWVDVHKIGFRGFSNEQGGVLRDDASYNAVVVTPIRAGRIDRWIRKRMLGAVIAVATVFAALAIAIALPFFSASLVVAILGGIAAIFAGLALGGLLRMMLRDVRILAPVFRRREKKQSRWHPDSRFWYASGSAGAKHV